MLPHVEGAITGVPDVRIRCAESGHWWSDHPFILVDWNRQKIAERVQRCMRDGCERERIERRSLRTWDRIGGLLYRGRIAAIGRQSRGDLQLELFRRQDG